MAPLILSRFQEKQFYTSRRGDPYRTDSKPKGTPQCTQCKAISIKGRWNSETEGRKKLRALGKSTANSLRGEVTRQGLTLEPSLCPACRQFKEHYALGVIEIHGGSDIDEREAELISQTVQQTERIARSRNDQQRILGTRTFRGVTKIYVTLPELGRQIGRTLQRAFKGEIEYHRSTEENYLRVIWRPHPEVDKRHRPRNTRSKNYRHRGFR